MQMTRLDHEFHVCQFIYTPIDIYKQPHEAKVATNNKSVKPLHWKHKPM